MIIATGGFDARFESRAAEPTQPIFFCSSSWGWQSDASLCIDGQKQHTHSTLRQETPSTQKNGVGAGKQALAGNFEVRGGREGLEAYGRGDRLQLLLDTDAHSLRFGCNGHCGSSVYDAVFECDALSLQHNITSTFTRA